MIPQLIRGIPQLAGGLSRLGGGLGRLGSRVFRVASRPINPATAPMGVAEVWDTTPDMQQILGGQQQYIPRDLTQNEYESYLLLKTLGRHSDDHIQQLYNMGRLDDPDFLSELRELVEGTPLTPRPMQTLPKPVIPGGYVAQPAEPGYQTTPRPMQALPKPVTPGGYVAQPAEPTPNPVPTMPSVDLSDAYDFPGTPDETFTVRTGMYRKYPTLGQKLPKTHPQYEAAQGHTFRIKPLYQVLGETAARVQSRMPTGGHSSPVDIPSTSTIFSKRSLPVRSPLVRRM